MMLTVRDQLTTYLPALLLGEITQSAVARKLHCSRERVRQVLRDMGMDQVARAAKIQVTAERQEQRARFKHRAFIREVEALRSIGRVEIRVAPTGGVHAYFNGLRVRFVTAAVPASPNGPRYASYWRWLCFKRNDAYICAVKRQRYLRLPDDGGEVCYQRVSATEPPAWAVATWRVGGVVRDLRWARRAA